MKKKLLALGMAALLGFSGIASLSPVTHASAATVIACSFTRDLQLGMVGEDVRCLQRYLNGAGFVIAASGVGAPGFETNQFQANTRIAVAKWQAANGVTVTGYFGPLSRARYATLITVTPTPVPTPVPTPTPAPSSAQTVAKNAILDARDAIENAEDDLDDSDVSSRDEDDAQDLIDEANDTILDALYAYVEGNYTNATNLANDARDDAEEASDIANDDDDDDDNDEGLTFAEATIFNNETVVKLTFDGDDMVFTTDSDDEDDIVDDILDEVDDDDLRRRDVEDELDIKEKNRNSEPSDKRFNGSSNGLEDDAQDAIDDAQDAIDDAREEIEDADDDGADVDDAYDTLDEAEDALDDAEDAFDDEEYEDAIDFAQEAEDLADEAIDDID